MGSSTAIVVVVMAVGKEIEINKIELIKKLL